MYFCAIKQVYSGANEACISAVILQRDMVSICTGSDTGIGALVPGAAALFMDSVQTIAKHEAERAGLAAAAPSLSMAVLSGQVYQSQYRPSGKGPTSGAGRQRLPVTR